MTDLSDSIEDRTSPYLSRRLGAIRAALDAPDPQSVAQALLGLAAKWTPDAFAQILGQGLELAAYHGREAVFVDADETGSFADPDVFSQPFKEQIDFLRQKRGKPTKTWLDAMHGTHDRAFVIAGATDMAMLSDFQNALADAMEKGTTLDAFRNEFDSIVAKYGWAYNGERGWRTRVIFETNMRTSYMAGRLKQMRDPDVLKLRPFWEYRHGETRTPKSPRAYHKAWHGKIFHCDDPFWETHFPPNDWLCSCGVRSLSLRDLKRRGMDGPDKAPAPLYQAVRDPASGQLVEQPQGIGFGWDYQPGHLWEQGLVPSSLLDQPGTLSFDGRHVVSIDVPEPLEDLLCSAVPFKSAPLAEGLEPEEYIQSFLKPFNTDIGQGVLFEDRAGAMMPVSDQLFRDRRGDLKVAKGDRATMTPLLAEALLDPDEIWLGVARKKDPVDPDQGELLLDRRYIRADPKTGLLIVFEVGARFWEAVTAYNTTTKSGKPDLTALDKRRGGKLLYKRPKK
ncbi:PBECR2 nuclease fold domain-containing protein [Rhizobium herbae]|uniref:Head morphogenesis protein n=1 Tax=Rhizobium herbae TaxID=508661 RepID=A0ABS4EW19_9HYPH|nr:hypothetical protein [Rhizobium herbae]